MGNGDAIYGLAQQPDGKIVAAGASNNGVNDDFAVARYHLDGSLDTTFNGTGKVTTSLTAGTDTGYGVALQTNGKIVMVGRSNTNNFGVVRYNTDGSLDTNFNTTGIVSTPFTGTSPANAVSIQADSKIVAVGFASPGPFVFAIARYNTDGSLDTTFNGTGKITTSPTGVNDFAYAVTLQPDGKIIAAGSCSSDFCIARYNTDGSLDTNFNTSGYVTTPVGSSADYIYSVAVQPDGKIVAAGTANNGVNDDFAVVRYLSNGSLDTSLNGTGKVMTPLGTTDYGQSVALQSNGKIILGGTATVGSFRYALTRYNTNGSLDTTFNYTGKIIATVGTSDFARTVFLQADGSVIIAGGAVVGATSVFALVRYR
jgi:uncharacterized delta-60 repeat protein